MSDFLEDVIHGLTSEHKHLQSKYLYGDTGDILFQKIMRSEQYYLTNCELEIFRTKNAEIIELVRRFESGFDLIELGAGDAFKSSVLIKHFLENDLDITYHPIDISENIIQLLEEKLPVKFPDLQVKGLRGDYFQMLAQAARTSDRPRLVLLLGANIGNMTPTDAESFCIQLHKHMKTGDLALIGFDLIKNPWIIFNAYNDRRGITKDFNLNLLNRINKELNADFNPETFDHFENYDPETGACKSYLISLEDQEINIDDTRICFSENEYIFIEISQKYTRAQITGLAEKCGFKPVKNLCDSRKWYTDVIWERL